MKIRNGFVSNSSSSSFIIRNGEDIKEIATDMLNTVIDDYREWDCDYGKVKRAESKKRYIMWRKNLKTALKRKDVLNGEIGITMPSCNYDTYIIRKNDTIYISTANNHQWNIDSRDIDYDETSEYEELGRIISSSLYFNVRNAIIHSKENWEMTEKMVCPKCKKAIFSYIENEKGEKICSNCYKGILGKTTKQIEKEDREKLQERRKTITNPITSLELD